MSTRIHDLSKSLAGVAESRLGEVSDLSEMLPDLDQDMGSVASSLSARRSYSFATNGPVLYLRNPQKGSWGVIVGAGFSED